MGSRRRHDKNIITMTIPRLDAFQPRGARMKIQGCRGGGAYDAQDRAAVM